MTGGIPKPPNRPPPARTVPPPPTRPPPVVQGSVEQLKHQVEIRLAEMRFANNPAILDVEAKQMLDTVTAAVERAEPADELFEATQQQLEALVSDLAEAERERRLVSNNTRDVEERLGSFEKDLVSTRPDEFLAQPELELPKVAAGSKEEHIWELSVDGPPQLPRTPKWLGQLEGEIRQLCCGADHVVIVTLEGRVLHSTGQFPQPRPCPQITDPVKKVTCGLHHSAALTIKGKLYCWGSSASGQCGIGAGVVDVEVPTMVPVLAQSLVVDMCCARRYTCACNDSGATYGWGQLLSSDSINTTPIRLQWLKLENIVTLHSGCTAEHFFAINAAHQMFVRGRTGAEEFDQEADTGHVYGFSSLHVVDAAAGDGCSMAITRPFCWSQDALSLDRECIKHSACVVGNHLVVFGGLENGGELSRKCSVLDLTSYSTQCYPWQDVSSSMVPPCMDHTATTISCDHMVLFGGLQHEPTAAPCSACYVLDTCSWQWTVIDSEDVPARFLHAATCIGQNSMLVFGGQGEEEMLNDIHILSQTNDVYEWRALEPAGALPPGRSRHSVNYLKSSNSVVVYGGFNGNCTLGDVWMLTLGRNTQSWVQIQIQGAGIWPSGGRASHHSMAAVAGDAAIIVLGGWTASSLLANGDVWRLDIRGDCGEWHMLDLQSDGAPSARVGSAVCHWRKQCLLVGGSAMDGNLSDAWWFSTSSKKSLAWFWGSWNSDPNKPQHSVVLSTPQPLKLGQTPQAITVGAKHGIVTCSKGNHFGVGWGSAGQLGAVDWAQRPGQEAAEEEEPSQDEIEHLVSLMMSKGDINGDGGVDLCELLTMREDSELRDMVGWLLADGMHTFKAFDTDHDQEINRSEATFLVTKFLKLRGYEEANKLQALFLKDMAGYKTAVAGPEATLCCTPGAQVQMFGRGLE